MKVLRLSFILCLLLGFCSLGSTEEVGEIRGIAHIIEIAGIVELKTPKQAWIPAKVGMILNEQDIIRTKKNSYCLFNLDGEGQTATVELKENSQLKLAQLLEDKENETQKTLLDLSLGEILIKAKKLHSEKSSFEVKTPTSVVGVRGTTFSVAVEAVE